MFPDHLDQSVVVNSEHPEELDQTIGHNLVGNGGCGHPVGKRGISLQNFPINRASAGVAVHDEGR